MAAKTTGAESVVATRLVNSRDVAIQFCLEPWGEQYEMLPAAIFDVVARGPEGDALEVTIGDDQITVWGWPGSVVTLFHNGTELGAGGWRRSPVPSMPPLGTTRSAVPEATTPNG